MAEISRWATTQARAEVPCTHCGAAVNESCTTPKGLLSIQHIARGKAYIDKIGRKEFFLRHRVRVTQLGGQ